jgi:hypothetical protein
LHRDIFCAYKHLNIEKAAGLAQLSGLGLTVTQGAAPAFAVFEGWAPLTLDVDITAS